MESCQTRWRRHTSRQISSQMECCICLEVCARTPRCTSCVRGCGCLPSRSLRSAGETPSCQLQGQPQLGPGCRTPHSSWAGRAPPAQVVMDKAPEQRRFGLMGCDHCFCLGCIRSWRSQSSADLDTVRCAAHVPGACGRTG